ncbi:CDP-alcohol phosphatidyltransferase-domain-containing protein [Cokeromyces recurvatus]|uniref:CDP-alcohol phosphatidyltransferase-domain-containing protein n=1 Tax=Cokeromyces recurvatus TaxID=90255 RepID=UPI00221F5E70|nr:CDP-alcohol phosphatidyltransferase-domain-containing protein [Cokeromyces recurvatus]KAI7901262.1 CDP-alcohol phosphatidyltransferase-domain-containing protein [Cokeromyces recurvatus]
MFKPSYYEYITEKRLENLRFYKYASIDKSYLSKYVLRHYWDFAITLFPKWIAPNLITLIGLLFMVINVIIICIWSPHLSEDAPNWICFSFAIGLWLYSTFDNVDGRQARRTGSSSPLGELFDHGCDAINCTFVALLQTAAFGLGHSWLAVILLFVTIAGFYLSTAEEYYTGVLYLGYLNGPTEGILVTCLAFIWSGIYGVSSWHVAIKDIPWLHWTHFPEHITCAELFIWAMTFFFLITHLPVCVYSIAQACNEKGLKKRNVFFNLFFPLFALTFIIWSWLCNLIIFKEQLFIVFAIYIGVLFGEMASDIILAHLTKSAFPSFGGVYTSLFLFYLTLALVTPLQRILHIYMIRAVKIIQAFCDFLNIRCFIISKQMVVSNTRGNMRSTFSFSFFVCLFNIVLYLAEGETESLLITQEEGTSYNTFL